MKIGASRCGDDLSELYGDVWPDQLENSIGAVLGRFFGVDPVRARAAYFSESRLECLFLDKS